MKFRPQAFRSAAILEVTVREVPAPSVLVVTQDPSVVDVVRSYLQLTIPHVSTVWMPTVASACRRSERDHPDMVVICGETNEHDALASLRSTSPQTQIVIFN